MQRTNSFMTFQNGTINQPARAGDLVPAPSDQVVPEADHAAV